MRWKKRIELLLLEFKTHQIRLFWTNWNGDMVWSPNIRAPLRRIWWAITGEYEKHMQSFINWKKKERDHWLRRYGFDPEKDRDIYLKAIYDENGKVKYYKYNMEEFIKRGYKPVPSELLDVDRNGEIDITHAPWNWREEITYFDTRRVIMFMDKGMDKCQNLNCLGKVEYGMERCPHCGVRLKWFDEPAPKGWA